ncbi:hypothetical protein FRC06_006177 [Ceratobasidium sp. 370]|nr:hypothetical protein FRC06_006177 [Ceratobasidium sp. 370]
MHSRIYRSYVDCTLCGGRHTSVDGGRRTNGNMAKALPYWYKHNEIVELEAEGNPYHLRVLKGHNQVVRALATHGRTAVSGSYDTTLKVWDLITGECKWTLTGHTQKVYGVAIDSERSQVVSSSMDGTARIWSLVTGQTLHTLIGHSSIIGIVGVSPTNIVTAAADSTLRVWNPSSGTLKHTLAAHTGAITCFQHDEYKVVSGSDGKLLMWDIREGKVVREMLAGLTGVWQVAYEGNLCVAASHQNAQSYLDIWDFSSGNEGEDEVAEPLKGSGGEEISDEELDPVSRHTTHRVRSVGPQGAKFQSYHPEPVFETYGVEGVDHPLAKRGLTGTPQDAAKAFLEDKLGIAPDALARKSGHSSDVVSNEYFRQKINGVPVANAVANVALKGAKVVSYGSSFVKPKSVAPATPKLTKEAAIAKAETTTGGKYNNWPTSLEYFAKDSDHVALAHVVQVQNDRTQEWYEAFVDATTGEVINIVSFVADASYRVVPFTSQDPTDGFQTLTDPHDAASSPNGWHQYGTTTTTTTSGNNVLAYKSTSSTGTTPQSSDTNNYVYDFDPAGTPGMNKHPATVNAFYVGNMMHDLLYRYGFTETAYNFQRDNNGKGGAQNDHVLISVQDSSGSNNANFATPPDGRSGQMRMFTWTFTSPNRDGALENDIVVHEYTHGLTNRLTGGGTGRCLQTIEAGGMGEGWSDALADWTEQKSAESVAADFTLGSYVYTKGIRDYPYSTNKTVNPLTYGSLRTRTEVHDAGEVWATIWHEIYAALVEKLGFSADKNNVDGTAGNIVALHLLVDALQLQPCNPTFIAARNAIIQADANRYAGANKCTLWTAFAKRGLGYGATTTKTDSTTLPSDC